MSLVYVCVCACIRMCGSEKRGKGGVGNTYDAGIKVALCLVLKSTFYASRQLAIGL